MEPQDIKDVNVSHDKSKTDQLDMTTEKKIRARIAVFGFVLFLVFVIGIFMFATNPKMGAGLSLSFIAGLSMIFLPCTLPMAFVIVPMTMGKKPLKGFLMAVSFGLGLAVTLSVYGAVIAKAGEYFGLTATTQLMLVVGGLAALIFGLSEIKLLKFRLPAYSGKFPDFIQKRGDYVKTFLLGLFLGNAGVGCPNPAFYILLGYIATVGDVFNGWFLGFVHGLGRAVPLIFLAILGVLGINATSKLTNKQDVIEKYMGWVLIVIGAFILTFGIFGHDWFLASGIHTGWEKLVVNVAGDNFGENIIQHTHKLVDTTSILKYGNMFFLSLIAFIIILFKVKVKPDRRLFKHVLIFYALVILVIGLATEWTFTLAPSAGHGGHVAQTPGDDSGMDHSAMGHMNHIMTSAQDIAKMPLKTSVDRVALLPYALKDGVKEFRLTVDEIRWEYEPGKYIHAWSYNGQVPGPEIRVTEGDKVRVIVKNNLQDNATSVHWHGLAVNWASDGVPGLTQKPIEPGEEFIYEFEALPAGTRFYHSHGNNHLTAAQQMDMGLSGAFIVEPKKQSLEYDNEYTLVLDEWDVLAGGVNPAEGHVHGAGVEGAVPEYNTFTINGNVFPFIDPIKVREGEKTLVRIINAGTTAFHPMHTHGHEFELVALDGNPVPKSAIQERNTYTVHPGETADFLLTANNPGNWLFHCHHVHHAAAGMIMLVEYEGFDAPDTNALRAMAEQEMMMHSDDSMDMDHDMDMMMNDATMPASDGHTDHTH